MKKKKKKGNVETLEAPKKKVKLAPPPNACSICRDRIEGEVQHKQKDVNWNKKDPRTQTLWYLCDRCKRKGKVKK